MTTKDDEEDKEIELTVGQLDSCVCWAVHDIWELTDTPDVTTALGRADLADFLVKRVLKYAPED